jgi:hypothetical protein
MNRMTCRVSGDRPSAISRRALLRRSAAAGGAALLPWTLPEAAAAAGDGADALPAADARTFFADPKINFEVLLRLGAASYGVAEFGEIATVVNRINARGPSYDAVFDEFGAMGRQVGRVGERCRRRGELVSAREAFLRAAEYLTLPVFFAVGTSDPSRQAAAYRAMQRRWHAAAALFAPAFERVRIPYGRTHLPGYFLRPPGRPRRRPTVILNNGNDAQNVDLYAFGGAAALARGYNALMFEGPGQGSVFFLRGIPFRPDWERVIRPVVDFLEGRRDVDRDRIAAIGWSQGGELVARAAAFEKRLAAVVLDPGGVDLLRGLGLPDELVALVREGKRDEANAEWDAVFPNLPLVTRFGYTKLLLPFGREDFYSQIGYLARFNVTRVAHRIEAPTLITDYEFDRFFAGQPQELHGLLRTQKRLVRFTSADGSEYHDAPMAPVRRNQVVFDWLDRVLR